MSNVNHQTCSRAAEINPKSKNCQESLYSTATISIARHYFLCEVLPFEIMPLKKLKDHEFMEYIMEFK